MTCEICSTNVAELISGCCLIDCCSICNEEMLEYGCPECNSKSSQTLDFQCNNPLDTVMTFNVIMIIELQTRLLVCLDHHIASRMKNQQNILMYQKSIVDHYQYIVTDQTLLKENALKQIQMLFDTEHDQVIYLSRLRKLVEQVSNEYTTLEQLGNGLTQLFRLKDLVFYYKQATTPIKPKVLMWNNNFQPDCPTEIIKIPLPRTTVRPSSSGYLISAFQIICPDTLIEIKSNNTQCSPSILDDKLQIWNSCYYGHQTKFIYQDETILAKSSALDTCIDKNVVYTLYYKNEQFIVHANISTGLKWESTIHQVFLIGPNTDNGKMDVFGDRIFVLLVDQLIILNCDDGKVLNRTFITHETIPRNWFYGRDHRIYFQFLGEIQIFEGSIRVGSIVALYNGLTFLTPKLNLACIV